MVLQVRDSIEIVHTSEYPVFLKVYFSTFTALLSERSKPMSEDPHEQKLRMAVLEILNRLPQNEILRPYVADLLKLAMQILTTDTEESALVCLRIIFDAHKNFRPDLSQEVNPFLDFVQAIYRNLPETLQALEEASAGANPTAAGEGDTEEGKDGGEEGGKGGDGGGGEGGAGEEKGKGKGRGDREKGKGRERGKEREGDKKGDVAMDEAPTAQPGARARPVQSMKSFRVVTECPLIVMFLFQLYPESVKRYVQELLPLMVQCISLKVESSGAVQGGLFADFKAAQVKTVSFLTYLLRSPTHAVSYQVSICQSIVDLLVTCPDSINIRKELLVATRHVLATEHRHLFFPFLDTLLVQDNLIGKSRACFKALRPLAYSLLAELIHHMRMQLSLEQMGPIIYMFSRNVHDPSQPFSVQMTCVRLILNLVESIYNMRQDVVGQKEGRVLLGRILSAFMDKFGSLAHQIPELMEVRKQRLRKLELAGALVPAAPGGVGGGGARGGGAGGAAGTARRADAGEGGAGRGVPLGEGVKPGSLYIVGASEKEGEKEISDCRNLVKTLVLGMKTLVWSITNFSRMPPSQAHPMQIPPVGLTSEEVRVTARLLSSGIQCLQIFGANEGETIEVYDHFATIFSVLDLGNFHEVFACSMDSLFAELQTSSSLVQIPAHLLASADTCRQFGDVLAAFLVGHKLDALGSPTTPEGFLVLRLFQLLFGSLAKFTQCESVLQARLVPLMEECLGNMRENPNPAGYIHLMRALFKALSGGKLEKLYHEFLYVLPLTAGTFHSMLEGPKAHALREPLVELCLTIPARLQALLPHLRLLMRPLLFALQSSVRDLVSLGMRTLEFWVDSLNPEFLEPEMAAIEQELMSTLRSHLRPHPYPFGAKTLQLLGKLGGRNRRFLQEPTRLDYKPNPEHGLRLILTFEPNTSFLVPLDKCITLARKALIDKNNLHSQGPMPRYYQQQALAFLRACLASVLNISAVADGDGGSDAKSMGEQLQAYVLRSDPGETSAPSESGQQGVKTKTQLEAEEAVFKGLVSSLVSLSTDPDLVEDRQPAEVADAGAGPRKSGGPKRLDSFMVHICQHFAILFAVHKGRPVPAGASGPVKMSGLREINPILFLDSLVEVLSTDNHRTSRAALQCLCIFSDSLVLLVKAREEIRAEQGLEPGEVPEVFSELLLRLVHCCYNPTLHSQLAGAIALKEVVSRISTNFVKIPVVKVARAFLHVLKRLPHHCKSETKEVTEALSTFLGVYMGKSGKSAKDGKETEKGGKGDGKAKGKDKGKGKSAASGSSKPDEFALKCVKEIVDVFAQELLLSTHSGLAVRAAIEGDLQKIAEWMGVGADTLLEPHSKNCYKSLFGRPLTSRSLESQIECMMAVRLCVSLEPPLLKSLAPEVVSFLQDVVKIAELEDSRLPALKSPNLGIHAAARLREECLRVLGKAVGMAEMCQEDQLELRSRIISVFFKYLTNRSEGAVNAAYEGLKTVVDKQALPRDLLQQSLRPVLFNLQRHTHLTLPLLAGLAKLLKLLSNQFNPTLGEKLLEHLKNWLEPEKLANTQRSWRPGEEHKVAAAMIDLFHLLPSSASKFLESAQDRPGLVALTIRLETQLPISANHLQIISPFRAPLTRYLNRYAPAAIKYFLVRMNNPTYFLRLLDIIRSKEGEPLLECLTASADVIVSACFSKALQESSGKEKAGGDAATPATGVSDLRFHGLKLVVSIVKIKPDWLQGESELVEALWTMWRDSGRIERLTSEEILPPYQLKESKWLVKCLMNIVSHTKEPANLFEIVTIFAFRSRYDYTFVKKFLLKELTEVYTIDEKRKVLSHFIQAFSEPDAEQKTLVYGLKHVVLPMLEDAFKLKGEMDLIPDDEISSIVKLMLDPPAKALEKFIEPLRIQLLQLATCLIKYNSSRMVTHRKELIKFGWNHLKREEQESKNWAFVNVCHFLSAFQAPEKIILQVYVALLRSHQAEGRALVQEALDALTPSLPSRLVEPSSGAKYPIWIRYTKKILVEEGHSNPHLVHIWKTIIRHADHFYSSRGQFVPHMVYSLSRLGLPQSSTIDNRQLAVELAAVIIQWDQRRAAELTPPPAKDGGEKGGAVGSKRAADPESPGSSPAKRRGVGDGEDGEKPRGKPAEEDDKEKGDGDGKDKGSDAKEAPGAEAMKVDAGAEYAPSTSMQETIVNFLVRMSFLMGESADSYFKSINRRSLGLLTQCLRLWSTTAVKMGYIERLVNSNKSRQVSVVPALTTSLEIMNCALREQPVSFLGTSLPQIMFVMEPTLTSENAKLVDALGAVLSKIHEHLAADASSDEAQKAVQYFDSLITSHFSAAAAGAARDPNKGSPVHIAAILRILVAQTKVTGHYLDTFSGDFVKLLKFFASEKIAEAASKKGRADKSKTTAAKLASNICMLLRLLSHKILDDAGQKQMLLHTLISLMTSKPPDGAILLEILNAIRNWSEKSTDTSSNLTVKETVLFLQRLAPVERHGLNVGDWNRTFLTALLQICRSKATGETAQALRVQAFRSVEQVFLMGLQAREPKLRHAYFQLHNASLGRTLFARLKHIVDGQEWEAMASDFWLKQGTDLLFAILLEKEPINLAPTSAKVAPVWDESWKADDAEMPDADGAEETGKDKGRDRDRDKDKNRDKDKDKGEEKGKDKDKDKEQDKEKEAEGEGANIQKYARTLLARHGAFMNTVSKLRVADMIFPLREFAQIDCHVAYHLWVLIFPIVWATLQKEEQLQLAKPMISLLSKEYHVQQAARRPNVVQALLEGISLSQPQPKIPSELIKFLGKSCNAWHIALPLLESHVLLFPQEGRCADALLELYKLLNEDDIYCGLWKRRCTSEQSRAGLSLVQHGFWEEAQDVFFDSITKSRAGRLSVSRAELGLWEEQWVTCARELNQWNQLADFGRRTENYRLLMDSLWKIADWHTLKDTVLPKIQTHDMPQLLMVQGYVHLQEGHVVEGDQCVMNGIQAVLQRWWQLPELGHQPHLPLLYVFQQLVELQESTRVLMELGSGQQQPQHSYSELKDILETWRLRTPNLWDPLSHWHDLLQWRNHMYNIVINAFKGFQEVSPQLHQLGYKDKAWSVNKLARIARYQNMCGVCVSILMKMYGYYQMEVQEAFHKIREQAMAYLEMPDKAADGLSLVNTVNLDYFQPSHQAEIFRLKACIYRKMGSHKEAQMAFSTSLALDKLLPEGWFSWGLFNQNMYLQTGSAPHLEAAASCFLQGMRLGDAGSNQQTPYILQKLAFDQNCAVVGQALSRFGKQVPVKVWLPHVAHMLLCLQRPEAPYLKPLLYRVTQEFPQAIYYALRAFLLDRRDEAQKHSAKGTLHVGPVPSAADAFTAGKELMDLLRQKWGGLVQELEMFIHEIGAKFVSGSEERLLAVVHALIHRCYKYPTASASPVPQNLRRELSSICKACFSVDSSSKHSSFLQQYKTDFLRDLDPNFREDGAAAPSPEGKGGAAGAQPPAPQASATFPASLGNLIKCLKRWKKLLEGHIEERLPSSLKLEDESRALQEMPLNDIEMPGQYRDPTANSAPVYVSRIGPDVDVVRRQGASHRRLRLLGSDGQTRRFLVQSGHGSTASCDERMAGLMNAFNRALAKSCDSHKRHLQFHTPALVQVWPQVRLIEDDPSYTSFMSAYEINCARYGREPDLPIAHFKEQCAQAIGSGLSPDAILDLRLRSFSDICTKLISENIITQFMYKTLSGPNHLWIFKKQLAHHLALTGLLCYLFKIAGRSPSRTLFSRSTGYIQQLEFFPQYDETYHIDSNEPVPFRLTRNLQTFLTPFGVEGVYVAAFASAAGALAGGREKQVLQSQLLLYFHDEVLNWGWRRALGDQVFQPSAEQLHGFAQRNVDTVLKHLDLVTPKAPSPGGGGGKGAAGAPPGKAKHCQQGVSDLVLAASSPKNLCRMDPTWHPWF